MRKASCKSKIIVILLSIAATLCFCNSAYAFQENAKRYPIKTFAHISNYSSNLSFEERVQCQKIIEEVYWSHRIWPEQNKQPKPPLDSIMSEAQIRAKVEDVIKKSNALEYYWKKPVTAEQVQAEMRRMAAHTRQPAILKQIWASLNNDPYLIAECFARPVLVDRLIRNSYSFDERFHGELKKQIQNELEQFSDITQMKSASGSYSETEWIKANKRKDEISERRADSAIHYTESDEEWEQLIHEFSGNAFVKERLGQLQEDENRFYIVISLIKEETRIKVAMREWRKIPFEQWWNNTKLSIDSMTNLSAYTYELPEINEDSCESDTWMININQPPIHRDSHIAIWTGTEMIIWGGFYYYNNYFYLSTGGRYNPSTDTWTAITMINAPIGREYHTAVWTGTEMIVWGGYNESFLGTGGRYDPTLDSWIPTSLTNAPSMRGNHTAVWTGTEMIIWGGYAGSYLNTGGKYDPTLDLWIPTSITNAPSMRGNHTAVWTGTEMIIWGGRYSDAGYLNTGGRYDPTLDSWIPISITDAPSGRGYHTAVWTGTEMIAWGGYSGISYLNTGGKYDPTSDTWIPASMTNAPTKRGYHTAVWTGTEMIIWGGRYSGAGYLNSGGRYSPIADIWTSTSITNAPSGRGYHTAVWTGTEMIIWGGYGGSYLNTGARYDPTLDSWIPTSITDAPSGREYHTAVWTGTEMIVWGGYDGSFLNTGGKYDPALDIWIPTSLTNAPSGREYHTAVWTGTEMIVWGGYDGSYLNIGGKYDPASDTWIPTSITNAPSGREYHTAVWTGTEMIVWGGYDGSFLNTGARYSPKTDTWIATSITNAPSGRRYHTAVWTGIEMIVWGGRYNAGYFNTGGRYNPASNSWTPTSPNAPSEREYHTAVWTGTEMIVWGGYGGSYLNTGGRYNPASDSWTPTLITNAPTARYLHTVAWTGTEIIIWGGYNYYSGGYFNTGGRYNPDADTWTITSIYNAPTSRDSHTAVWIGTEMIIWGGYNYDSMGYLNTTGRYCACRAASSTISATPSPNQIIVHWSLVSGATSYEVYRRYAHCQQQVEELIGDHVLGDTFIDSTVNPGKLYEYSVKSSGQCESAPSTWVQAQSMGECILLPCFAGIANFTNNQCAIMLKWSTAVSDCDLSPEISYTIYRDTIPDFIPSSANQIATCIHDIFYVDHNVSPDITYYYIVRAEDSSANGSGPCNNGNIDSNLIRMSGFAFKPNITLFFDGFESGTGNWSISSNWQQTNLYAHTGAYSAYPLYEDNMQCTLMTQTNTVDIPATALTPQLHFWTMHYIESGLDAGIVEGSSDGNAWTKLGLTPDYPGTTMPSAQACLGINPQPAFTGDSSSWTEYISGLTSYAGIDFKMRFNFATNDSITRTGWFIDDVNIDYRAPSCTSSAPPAGQVLNNLFITKSNSNPKLDWTAVGGTCTVTNYAVYRGTLPWIFYNHNYLTCYVSPVFPLTYTDFNASGNYYYLVVPLNAVHEGSYGTTSYGTERPQGASACKWQKLLSCE